MTDMTDTAAVRKKFADANMQGAIALLDYLASDEGSRLVEIGSSSIGPSATGRLYLGMPPNRKYPERTVRAPIEDLAGLSLKLDGFTAEQQATLDGVLGEFARIHSAPSTLILSETDF